MIRYQVICIFVAIIFSCFATPISKNDNEVYKNSSAFLGNQGRGVNSNGGRFFFGTMTSMFDQFAKYFSNSISSSINSFFGEGDDSDSEVYVVEKDEGKEFRKSYKNFQLFRLYPRSEEQMESLEGIGEEIEGVHFWTQPMKNQSTDVMVPPVQVNQMKSFLTQNRMEYRVLIKDLQRAIAEQNPQLPKPQKMEQKSRPKKEKLHEMTFKRYHRYADMLSYMNYLTVAYPNKVEVMTIGKSSLGRPLKVIKISSGLAKNGDPKPIVWIDGGMHAREWISPAVVMYMIKQLVENYKGNKKIVDGADWYILPVANPDGYEYSHTTDRLWRKTRSNQEESELLRRRRRRRFFWESACVGVDANRNWGFHWGERGASDDPCHETYAGPKAFSEPETRAMSDFIMDRKDRVRLFLTMHAYSQMWLIPWGYTNKKVGDYDDLMSMGKKAVDAIARAGGSRYDLGSSTALMYPTSGASDDWAKGVAGIKYAYTVELRDKGSYGFMLPAKQIVPTGKETFAAVKALARAIVCKT